MLSSHIAFVNLRLKAINVIKPSLEHKKVIGLRSCRVSGRTRIRPRSLTENSTENILLPPYLCFPFNPASLDLQLEGQPPLCNSPQGNHGDKRLSDLAF